MGSVRTFLFFGALICLSVSCQEQEVHADEETEEAYFRPSAQGSLFIIGGGSRPDALVQTLVDLSLKDGGYGLVFTQSSGEPDTSFHYINIQLAQFTGAPIFHLDSVDILNFPLDSIESASLIYITGGNQNNFLRRVPQASQNAIMEAYKRGATIAGTSAGAALMSEVMITGDQNFEPEYEPTFSWLRYGNGIYQSGLGLLDSIIIDQHFVARSRYNRLISALADTDYPYAIGIEESTALVVSPETFSVVGEGQVMVFRRPIEFKENSGQIGFRNLTINAYLEGDTFKLKK